MEAETDKYKLGKIAIEIKIPKMLNSLDKLTITRVKENKTDTFKNIADFIENLLVERVRLMTLRQPNIKLNAVGKNKAMIKCKMC